MSGQGRPQSQSPVRRKSLAPTPGSQNGAPLSGIPRAILNTKRAQSQAASEIARDMASAWDDDREGGGVRATGSGVNTGRSIEAASAAVTQPLPRRNVPLGPRKSSIRSRPPQIFASPTGMTRSPNAPASRRQSMAGGAAAPGPDQSPKRRAPTSPLASRQSYATVQVGSNMDAAAQRKKRRVTFSTRQERTDFMRDEPTMHIRPPIETDMTNSSNTTTSSTHSEQDSLIPRLSGYGNGLDDDRDDTPSEQDEESSESEEPSSEEEQDDESAIDMDLTTSSDQQQQGGNSVYTSHDDEDDKTMDLTAAIASISDRTANASDDEADSDGGEQSMDLTHITAHGPHTRRRSSGAASVLTDGGSVDMDITTGGDFDGNADDSNIDMDITGVSAGSQPRAPPDTDDDDEQDDAMDLTVPFQQPSTDSAPVTKSKLRARDSLAALTGFGRKRNRPSVAAPPVPATDADADASADDSRTSTMHVDELMPQPKQETPPPSVRGPPTPSKSPGALRRFRQSLARGVSTSPKSPARREQVIMPANEAAAALARRSFGAPATPSRSSSGSLPSARSLEPGKVPTPFKSRPGGANARSSIVAAVLPTYEQEGEDDSGGNFDNPEGAWPDEGEPVMDAQEDPPPRNLTLSEFFSLSGMHFNDDTRALKVRVVPPASKRDEDDDDEDKDTSGDGSLLDALRIKAMAGSVPMLESLSQACRELNKSVSVGSKVLQEIEDKFVESPPDLVRELLSLSSEAEKKEMESQFKLQKQAARAIAKEGYLGWCLDNQYGPEMVSALEKTKQALEDDVASVEADAARMQEDVLPVLRDRKALLESQVERLRARQAQIDSTPVAELEVLHAGMAELLPELQTRRSAQREKTDAVERMRAKLRENLSRKTDLEESITAHRKVCEQISGYTRLEASRLASEIRQMERLHLWKIRSASLGKLHLEHDGTFDLVVELDERAQVQGLELGLLAEGESETDVCRVLTREVAQILRQEFAQVQEQLRLAAAADEDDVDAIQVSHLIRHISTVWTSIRHLQSEVVHLSLFFPISAVHVERSEDGEGTDANTIVITLDITLPLQGTKLALDLHIDLESLVFDGGGGADGAEGTSQWVSEFAQSLALRKIYGPLDSKTVEAVRSRIVERMVGNEGKQQSFVLGAGADGHLVSIVTEALASVL